MEKLDKIIDKIVIIFLVFMTICIAISVYIFIDFYNDYKCSTRDEKYFNEHNCVRYLKWKTNILN